MAVYRGHSVSLDADAQGTPDATTVHIPDIIDFDTPFNPEFLAEITGAHAMPTHVSIAAIKPIITFSTFAIEAVLDQTGTTGMPIVTTGANAGVILNLQQLDNCGDPASGSVHRTLTVADGCLVPQRITSDNRGNARLTCAIFPIGSSATVAVSDVAALPTLTIASARWTLGQTKVGNITLSDYMNADIDFGNNVETDGAASAVYDSHVANKTVTPSMTFRGVDPAWFSASNIPIGGIAATHANTEHYLRKRSQDGSHFVADGTAEHIKLTMAGVSAIDGAASGQAARIAETSLRVVAGRDSSGNNPLIATTSSAIT